MNPLDKVMGELNKKYGDKTVTQGMKEYIIERVPFTSMRINYCLYGGLPTNKAVEFFGPEGSGKTTSALDIVANMQFKEYEDWANKCLKLSERITALGEAKSYQKEADKLREELAQLQDYGPRKCVYVDAENTLDVEWAQKLGVDTDSLMLIQPQEQTAEQVLQMVLDIIDSGQAAIVVIDSLPMLVSQQVFEESLEKKSYCGIAAPLTTFCSKVSAKLAKYNTLLLGINQVREDIENPYNQFNTPGGKGWKHLCAGRLSFRKGAYLDENNEELANKNALNPAGNKVDFTIAKSKFCKNDRRVGFYTLKYLEGIDALADLFDLAIRYDMITKSGTWYSAGDFRCQGRKAFLEEMRTEPDWAINIIEKINIIAKST